MHLPISASIRTAALFALVAATALPSGASAQSLRGTVKSAPARGAAATHAPRRGEQPAQPAGPQWVAGYVKQVSLSPDGVTPMIRLAGLLAYVVWPEQRMEGATPDGDEVARHVRLLDEKMRGQSVLVSYERTKGLFVAVAVEPTEVSAPRFQEHALRTADGLVPQEDEDMVRGMPVRPKASAGAKRAAPTHGPSPTK